jgi:hypothetical protein
MDMFSDPDALLLGGIFVFHSIKFNQRGTICGMAWHGLEASS